MPSEGTASGGIRRRFNVPHTPLHARAAQRAARVSAGRASRRRRVARPLRPATRSARVERSGAEHASVADPSPGSEKLDDVSSIPVRAAGRTRPSPRGPRAETVVAARRGARRVARFRRCLRA